VKYKGKSIFEYGDISTCSFHATKLFHSGEGGAVFCKNRELKDKVFYSHNFGHKGPLDFYGLGINGKMSELSGAMGLSLLPHLLMIIQAREEIVNQYDKFLNLCNIRKLKIRDNTIWNFSYYPIIFKNENSLLKAQKVLNESEIYPRRYFYPSLSNLPYVNEFKTPISDDISSRILCLPLYYGLKDKEIGMISRLIINSIIS
jgi:dTDP-4-amino-4,6-dideoxygalactose transaminase